MPGKAVKVHSSTAIEIARKIQRRFPTSMRRRLERAVAWYYRKLPPARIEGWSEPLVGRSAVQGTGPIWKDRSGSQGAVVKPASVGMPLVAADPDLEPCRCLFVTGLFDVGGMEEMVAFLARRLTTKGMQTAVLHATSDPSPTGAPRGRIGRMLASTGVVVREVAEREAEAWIQQWRPDVLSAHGAPDWVLDIANRLGIPYVDNLHGMHTLFEADWTAEGKRSARLSAVVAVSELVRQQYLARVPEFAASRIVTIPNGIDEERRTSGDRVSARARLGLTSEYLFVSLARHCMQKNGYGLITAFGEIALRRPQAHLVIAGNPHVGRYYRKTLQLRDGLPWADRVHLRDHAAAPAELLAAADGFVLDSFFEGWSVASTEALFAGVPAVLSEVGGASELIGDDPARGRLVANPLGDPLKVDWESVSAASYRPQANREEFADAMDQLVVNRDEYLSNRPRLAAESAVRFSADACLTRHAKVLRNAAAGNN